MADLKPFAFVLMPFDTSFRDAYRLGIKECADALGIVAERVDEQHFSETILERIYRQIENCDFVIAEMTGRNANVFYEVGYAHARSKLCILITQRADDIPFDLKLYPHIIYDGTAVDLREKLKPKLEWILEEYVKEKQKIISINAEAEWGFLQKTEYAHSGSFDLIVTLRNNSKVRSPELAGMHLRAKKGWKLEVDGKECDSDPAPEKDKLNVYRVPVSVKELYPGMFTKIKIRFSTDLWTKWGGLEQKEKYSAKGTLPIEVVTSGGNFSTEVALDIDFMDLDF